MKQLQNYRLRTILFILFNIFAISQTFASGSKMPDVASSEGTFSAVTTKEAYISPWRQGNTSIVIDAYEGNSINWDKMQTDAKVVGVIHRSSIGMKKDTAYESRKGQALSRGYLWGAYHLGLPGNTIAQADLFIKIAGNDPDTLMFLDLEDTSNGKFMSINEAVKFMEYVYEKTGKIMVVYANHASVQALNAKVKNHPLFQQAKLWYARYKPAVTDFPKGIWQGYFLWQFSSELNCSATGSCLYNVPGTTSSMDINVFYGDKSELAQNWNNH